MNGTGKSTARPRWAPIAVLIVIVSGCTSTFLYDRLDTLAGWYVENLVSLDDEQRLQMRSWLEQTLQWHRQSELTRYTQFLRDMANERAQPGTIAAYRSAQQRIEGFYDDLLTHTGPEAAQLLLQLSPSQFDEFQRNLEKKASKNAREPAELVRNGEWHKRRTKQIAQQLKGRTGAISEVQQQIIENTVAKLEPTYAQWLESQQRWRAALRAAWEKRATQEAAHAQLLELLKNANHYWSPEYRRQNEQNRIYVFEMLAALDASLSASQRQRLREEFVKLAEQLERLAEG